MKLKYLVTLLAVLPMVGCASHQIARDVKLISLTSEPTEKNLSYGNIEGRSCQWTVMGYPVGEEPRIRQAFENAAKQVDVASIPGLTKAQQTGPTLSVLKNVSTGNSFLGLYLVSRSCITAEGLGYL